VNSSKQILHIANDEKFVDSVICQFETVAPNQNDYFIFVKSANHKIKYIKKISKIKIIIINSLDYHKLVDTFRNYKAVLVHGIYYDYARLIIQSRSNVKFYGFIWGGDIFNLFPHLRSNNYLPLTKKKFKPLGFAYNLKKYIQLFAHLTKLKESRYEVVKQACLRLNFVDSMYDERCEFLLDYNIINKNVQFFKFTYYSIENLVTNEDNYSLGNNILLGNSSFATNNHADAMTILSKVDLVDKIVICPLSYGDIKYQKKIISFGNKIFGKNFKPLTDFMDIEKYSNMIRSCNIAIMNNLRPQAFGNIVISLWLGIKVYIQSTNYMFKGLQNKGLIIFDFNDDFKINDSETFLELTDKQKKQNRNALKEFIGEDALLGYVRELVDNILK